MRKWEIEVGMRKWEVGMRKCGMTEVRQSEDGRRNAEAEVGSQKVGGHGGRRMSDAKVAQYSMALSSVQIVRHP